MRGMDIAAYLKQQKAQLAERTRAIRDFTVFNFEFVPEQPLIRDEAKPLIDDLLRFDVSGIPTHYAIIGSRGSGKTLTVKYLQRTVPRQTGLTILYANCREHNTSFKLVAHLLNASPRGVSLVELFAQLTSRYTGKTVIVLDEVDLMSVKDRRREILYLLSRSATPFMVLMLSNNPHVLKELDPPTRSSLQPVPSHFRNYDAQQIRMILETRAQRGLVDWEAQHLGEIAALTARETNADVRVAIKTLFYLVTQQGDLRTCFERARRDIVVDVINDLSDHPLLILRAVEIAKTDFAKDIYRVYGHLCRDRHETPFSYMHFNSNLGYLQSVGLVALISTKVKRTYANRVLLNFEQPLVQQIFQLRFAS
jgi:Cdc6-like AAA superfamily ATPase